MRSLVVSVLARPGRTWMTAAACSYLWRCVLMRWRQNTWAASKANVTFS